MASVAQWDPVAKGGSDKGLVVASRGIMHLL